MKLFFQYNINITNQFSNYFDKLEENYTDERILNCDLIGTIPAVSFVNVPKSQFFIDKLKKHFVVSLKDRKLLRNRF